MKHRKAHLDQASWQRGYRLSIVRPVARAMAVSALTHLSWNILVGPFAEQSVSALTKLRMEIPLAR